MPKSIILHPLVEKRGFPSIGYKGEVSAIMPMVESRVKHTLTVLPIKGWLITSLGREEKYQGTLPRGTGD